MREIAHRVRADDGAPLALHEIRVGARSARAPAFLLIHGFAQNRITFLEGELPLALAERGARVFVGELSGHGHAKQDNLRTAGGLVSYLRHDLPALMRAVAELTEAPQVHLIGHSMGGILGYAYLPSAERLASLITLGAPVILGTGRPELVQVARLLRPLVGLGPRWLPTHVVQRAASRFSIGQTIPGWRGAVRERIRLGNPEEAAVERLRTVLTRGGEPSHKQVLLDLLEIAAEGRAQIAGVDLLDAVTRSPVPLMAVIGGRDIFAPRASVAPLELGAGRRRIVELAEAGHIDIAMGRRAREVASAVWSFSVESS